MNRAYKNLNIMKFAFCEVEQKQQYVLNSITIRTRNHPFVVESVISFAKTMVIYGVTEMLVFPYNGEWFH